MIGRTILTALILFLLYNVFVSQFAPRWWNSSQHQWQDNVIKAQKYVYNAAAFENVIVGSSLSCRIKTDSLCNTYNLAFQGQSFLDGLSILNQCKNSPQRVLIEMNILSRPENKDFVLAITSPGMRYVREYLLAMREENQPLGALGKYMNIRIGHLIPHSKSATVKNHTKDLFAELLNRQKNAYAKLVDSIQLKHTMDNLAKYVRALEARKIKIVFFEMPLDNEIIHSPRENQIREQFYSQFDKSKYKFIVVPVDRKYKTTDGIHLADEDARIFSGYLKSQLACSIEI